MNLRLLLSLAVTLTAQLTFADQPQNAYSYQTKLSYATGGKVAACPNIQKILITDTGTSGNILLQVAGAKNFTYLSANGESSSCMSDILCETTIDYRSQTNPIQAWITRNNDGNYPTSNLPGFSRLSLDLSDTLQSNSTYCYYDLK
jgi:hypothetical protein